MIHLTARESDLPSRGTAQVTAFTLDPDRLLALKRRHGDNWFNYAELLDEAAFEIKQEFLDEISALGRFQNNPLLWWSSKFASKNPHQSDLFLLTCYTVLISRLPRLHRELWCFVEEPWLYHTLWENLRDSRSFRFYGRPAARLRLWHSKVKFWTKALLLPLATAFRGGYRLFKVRQSFKPRPVQADGLLYSWVEKRSFNAAGEFTDVYLGNLRAILENLDKRVVRLADINFDLRLMDLVKTNKMVPVESYGSYGDLLGSLLYVFRIPGKESLRVGSLGLGYLITRAELDENASSGIRKYYSAYQMFRRLKQSWRQVGFMVYPFENQPWEKVMLLALKTDEKMAFIGHQHSTLPELVLNYYPGKYEKEAGPLPDVIACSSEYHVPVLQNYFSPRAKVINVGALRHGRPDAAPGKRDPQKIAVFLPINRRIAKMMLDSLLWINASDYKYLIKAHPDVPVDGELKGAHLEVTSMPAERLMQECSAVIYASTACGVQGAERGLKVFLFRHEYLETYAGGRQFNPRIIRNFKELEAKIGEIPPPEPFAYFSPANPPIWGEILRRRTPNR